MDNRENLSFLWNVLEYQKAASLISYYILKLIFFSGLSCAMVIAYQCSTWFGNYSQSEQNCNVFKIFYNG